MYKTSQNIELCKFYWNLASAAYARFACRSSSDAVPILAAGSAGRQDPQYFLRDGELRGAGGVVLLVPDPARRGRARGRVPNKDLTNI